MDPGVFTGLATYTLNPVGPPEHQSWEYPDDPCLVSDNVRDFADRGFETVTERFLISKRTLRGKVYYQSLYLEGWIMVEYPDTAAYTPAQAKGLVTDDLLRFLGWFNKTKDGHANDASRHLFFHLQVTREPWALRKLKEYADA